MKPVGGEDQLHHGLDHLRRATSGAADPGPAQLHCCLRQKARHRSGEGDVLRDGVDIGRQVRGAAEDHAVRHHPGFVPAKAERGAADIAAIDDPVAIGVKGKRGRPAVAMQLERQPPLAAEIAGRKAALELQIGGKVRQRRIVVAGAQRAVVVHADGGIFVAPRAFDRHAACQPVGIGDAVIKQIGRIADRLKVDPQLEIAGQGECAVKEQIPARLAGADVVVRERAVRLDGAGGEGLPVAQTQRPGPGGGGIGRHRQVAVIAKGDEIRKLQAGAEFRGRPHLGLKEACRAFQRRVRHPEARQVEDRNPRDAELGVVEIDLPFQLIMDDTAGADFPQRHRVRGADLAGGGDDLVHPGIAPVDAVDFQRGQLKLLVHDHAGAFQQSVLQVARQVCAVG